MRNTLRIFRAWFGLLLACLVPMSCLVESEGELRVFAIELDRFPMDSGYLVVFLTDTTGEDVDKLYKGTIPPDRTLRVSAPNYDGGEAILVLQEYLRFQGEDGDTLLTADNLLREYRLRVRQGDSARMLPSAALPLPARPFPPDSAEDVALDVELRWLLGATLPPGPTAQIRFGTANPPPLLPNSSTQGDSSLFPGGALLPDREYFWQITSVRGRQSRPGPVWSFRTRPLPPDRLAYPPCDTCHLGWPVRLVPDYAGGGRVRYRVTPPLPAGLELDSLTGIIAGMPGSIPDGSAYTVVAVNASGKAEADLRLAIRPRLIDVPFDRGMWPAGARAAVTLLSPEGALIDTLWSGPAPSAGPLRWEAPRYDGEEAQVLVQLFLDSVLIKETRLRVWQSRGILESMTAPPLVEPILVSPQNGASGLDTEVELIWDAAADLRPPPLAELRLGLADPPPVVDTCPAGARSASFRVMPDTVYYWQVVNLRAGKRAAGPVRSFRTRALPPSSLRYPGADSVFHAGADIVFLTPEYDGGRARFSTLPPLPEGFVLDSMTGVLSIRPTAESGPVEYRIVARNESGSTEAPLRFRVDSWLYTLDIPDSMRLGDSLSVQVMTPSGALLASLWDGAPPALPSLRWSRGHDDGGELHVVSRAFRAGTLLLEYRYRLLGRSVDRLPPVLPGAPARPSPMTGALNQDTLLTLAWEQDSLPGPPPLWRLRFGFTEPPPVLQDSLREPRAALPTLLPDTLYRWSVSALRAGAETPGPVWSFRTRPAPPQSLAYPADSVLHIARPVALLPTYVGGTRVRYRVQPPLPPGLLLDSLTGRLAGIPTDTASARTYVVTAQNVSGSAQATVRLRVDWRRVDVVLPEEARGGDSAVVRLLDRQGNALDTLWEAPLPADLRVGAATPRYDGVEAGLRVLVFLRGLPFREYGYAVRGPLASAEVLTLGSLPIPVNLTPAESAQVADTVLSFAWRSGISDAPTLSRLYLGTDFPPPLFADSVRGDSVGGIALRPGTRYYWRVETLRGIRSALGAVTGFRTRPAAPGTLAYSVSDTLLPLDRDFSIAPAWTGGGGTFRIEPASLPRGWAFNPATGVLYGTPVTMQPVQEYAVTLTNVSGSVTARFRLGVGHRVLDFLLPDTALRYDSLFIKLTRPEEYWATIHDLWKGRGPGDLRVRREVPWYEGGEAKVVIQGYNSGALEWESIRRINMSQRIFERHPLPVLEPPTIVTPTEASDLADPALVVWWNKPYVPIDPQPVQKVYFGLTNPPPLVADSVWDDEIVIDSTLEDTVYYWRVVAIRGRDTLSSRLVQFRSYYTRPRPFSYPGLDSVYTRGVPMRLEPLSGERPGYPYRYWFIRPMPPGIELDTVTGIISGTPNGPAPRLDYVLSYGPWNWRFHTDTLRFRVADDGDTTVSRVALWEMEESGGVAADSSGNGFHGEHNATAWIDGVRGRAMRFDDTTFVRVRARDALQVAGFTLSYWIRPEDLKTMQVLGEYVGMETLGVGCTIGASQYSTWPVPTPGAVLCNIRPSDFPMWKDQGEFRIRERNILGTPGNLLRAKEWNHVALTFNPRTWEAVIYVNGVAAASRVLEGNFTPITKGQLYLGLRGREYPEGTTLVGFKGGMDHVEVFDGPLGAAAIQDMYRSLAPR